MLSSSLSRGSRISLCSLTGLFLIYNFISRDLFDKLVSYNDNFRFLLVADPRGNEPKKSWSKKGWIMQEEGSSAQSWSRKGWIMQSWNLCRLLGRRAYLVFWFTWMDNKTLSDTRSPNAAPAQPPNFYPGCDDLSRPDFLKNLSRLVWYFKKNKDTVAP